MNESECQYTCRLGEQSYWDEHYEMELRNYEDTEDEGLDWFSENIGSRLIDWLCRENAIGMIPDGFDIIDLGCGNGAWLFEIEAKRNWKGRLLGVDNSTKGIELASTLAKARESDAEFCVADIHSLSMGKFHCVHDKGTYDAFMLHKDNRIEDYTAAVLRSLHPQGRLILTSCNHTAEELITDLSRASNSKLRHIDTLRYPTFRFGGREGAAVSTVSFRL
mmetsp:Transcript_13969/g.21009  ORF Transcript_13969/g.21009 Transcript_13969/m.21009 type:complete len:220 (-) Transcript_13969:1240-1899(-)